MDIKSIVNALAGPDDFEMQHRIFICAISSSLVTLIPSIFFVAFLGRWLLSAILVVYAVIYVYIFMLCRYWNQLQRALLVFTIVGSSLLNVAWMADRGPQGGAPFFLMVVMIIIIFTAENPIRYIVAVTLNVLAMCLLYHPLLPYVPFSMPASYIGQSGTLLFSLVFSSFIAYLYRNLIRKKADEALEGIVAQLVDDGAGVNQTADSLAESSEQLLAAALQQKSATEQLSVTTEELGATADQNSQMTAEAIERIRQTEEHVNISKDRIQSLQESIDKIRASSEEIQTINNVINDISYQTNILSLNAMIEASRSSDGSGGFKVVALEVKKLAERSAKAAESINKLLISNLSSVEEGVEQSTEMHARFNDIAEGTGPLVDLIRNVSDASAEQNEAIRQIVGGLNDIDRAVDENRSLAQESSATAQELKSNAANMMELVNSVNDLINEQQGLGNITEK